VGDLRALRQSWKIRYLPFVEPRILTAEEVGRLGLPETPEWLHFYGGKRLAPLLQYDILDPLRARGFPHDILVLLISDDLSPEGVWLRMDEVVREIARPAVDDVAPDRPQELLWVRGTLLNDPHQDFGVHPGDVLMVGVFLFADGPQAFWNADWHGTMGNSGSSAKAPSPN
jgi:hypothetical protein